MISWFSQPFSFFQFLSFNWHFNSFYYDQLMSVLTSQLTFLWMITCHFTFNINCFHWCTLQLLEVSLLWFHVSLHCVTIITLQLKVQPPSVHLNLFQCSETNLSFNWRFNFFQLWVLTSQLCFKMLTLWLLSPATPELTVKSFHWLKFHLHFSSFQILHFIRQLNSFQYTSAYFSALTWTFFGAKYY